MKFTQLKQRGDTILEVMICVAVVGMLLAAAFALSSRNTIAGLRAQERSIGVKIAESQLERLKSYADLHKLPDRNALFCMVRDDSKPTGIDIFEFESVTPSPDREADLETDYPAECQQVEQAFAYEFVIWSPNRSGQVGGLNNRPYAITVRWDAAGGGERQEVKMFYNIYDTSNPDLTVSGAPPDLCRNGIDDDDDGRIDFGIRPTNDPGCTSADDNDETNPQCNNGRNDDDSEDSLVDFPNDPGCDNLQDNSESPNPLLPLNFLVNGNGYTSSSCVNAEPMLNDGSDRCFITGTSMYAWREVSVSYPTPGLTPGPATIEIKYRQWFNPPPAGYTHYDFDINFAGSTTNHRWPVAAQGVQRPYSIPVTIPSSVPGNITLEWKNNVGNDPNIQIDSIRIYR